MFPAEKPGEWEPLFVREKRVKKTLVEATEKKEGQDVSMGGTEESKTVSHDTEEVVYEEDPTTDEGAVYPLSEGKVTDWSCFFALLTHVYNTLSPPFHTPILMIAQPAWTQQDHEILTQFFFEKFKTPAFALMDSALTACYAYSVSSATVVDVGYEKCDITAVSDFIISDIGRGIALPGSGGEAMTQRFVKLFESKGFSKDMCEQLKKSNICEILPSNTAFPSETESIESTNPAAAASTGVNGAAPGQKGIVGHSGLPRGAGPGTEIGEEPVEENDGVLDVASIVASGKTSDFLAKKEREKAEKAAAKKGAADTAAAAKVAKLPNSQRAKALFHYDERRSAAETNGLNSQDTTAPTDTQQTDGEQARPKTPEAIPPPTDSPISKKEERRRNRETSQFVRKEIEVGVERFRAADDGLLDRIADAIHRCILSIPEVNKRGELWDSLIILGNGSKVRGKLSFLSTPQQSSIH